MLATTRRDKLVLVNVMRVQLGISTPCLAVSVRSVHQGVFLIQQRQQPVKTVQLGLTRNMRGRILLMYAHYAKLATIQALELLLALAVLLDTMHLLLGVLLATHVMQVSNYTCMCSNICTYIHIHIYSYTILHMYSYIY